MIRIGIKTDSPTSTRSTTRFAREADTRFVLRAPERPDVPAAYSWVTIPRRGGQRLVLAVRRGDLAEGVEYSLVPLNDRGTRRWVVKEDVRVVR